METNKTIEVQQTQTNDWFGKLLVSSNQGIGSILKILEFICRSLLELTRTFVKISLALTIMYAILIWRHYPAPEPKTFIVCWCAALIATNLGQRALDGPLAPPIYFPISLLIIAYWLPVNAISKLIQAF